jgi:5-oxoprolinase (ATP-hydrolysing) subunit A
VACGFHAGDPSTLRERCAQAASRGLGVRIGAQVAYPDLVGFGRRYLADGSRQELRDVVLYQLGALDGFAQVAGGEVAYVKPHGALYHATVDRPDPGARPGGGGGGTRVRPLDRRTRSSPGSALLKASPTSHGHWRPVDRGLRRPRLSARRSARSHATEPESLGAPRPRRGRLLAQALRIVLDREVVAVDGSVVPHPGAFDLPARRHPRRRGPRPCRARRARAGRCPRAPVHRVTDGTGPGVSRS